MASLPSRYPSELADYLAAVSAGSHTFLPADVEAERYGKVLNDVIHGHITLHPLLVQVIDTEEFQRLREIKALGMTCYLYPTANHRRFEHSVGVAHLAGRFVNALARKQPELEISRSEELCVMLAGLLHDVGHGPFSHTFEKFMEAANPSARWMHEQASLEMIDYIIKKKTTLSVAFAAFGLGDQDIHFIKELIFGPLNGCTEVTARPRGRHFLYEIVSNKTNGIDVDKWDYLARDRRQVSEGGSFDHQRFIDFSRVLYLKEDGNRTCIAFRDKEVASFYDMFNVRYRMHKKVYRHRVSLALEAMIVDAMVLADKYVKFYGSDGTPYSPSEAYRDMSAFALMDDGSIRTLIKVDPREELQEAKALLKRIDERRLYHFLGRTEPVEIIEKSDEEVLSELVNTVKKMPNLKFITPETMEKNLIVLINKYDYGKGEQNPLEHVYFFHKKASDNPRTIGGREVSQLLPKQFQETEILLLYRSEKADEQKEAAEVVEAWSKRNNIRLKESSVALSCVKKHPPRSPTAEETDERDKAKRKLDF